MKTQSTLVFALASLAACTVVTSAAPVALDRRSPSKSGAYDPASDLYEMQQGLQFQPTTPPPVQKQTSGKNKKTIPKNRPGTLVPYRAGMRPLNGREMMTMLLKLGANVYVPTPRPKSSTPKPKPASKKLEETRTVTQPVTPLPLSKGTKKEAQPVEQTTPPPTTPKNGGGAQSANTQGVPVQPAGAMPTVNDLLAMLSVEDQQALAKMSPAEQEKATIQIMSMMTGAGGPPPSGKGGK